MAEDLGVHAIFLGVIDGAMRSALLDRADMLVIPSRITKSGRSEGTPITAIEGLAAGCPVIASDVGGLRWAIGDAGRCVPPNSPASLARELSQLSSSPEQRKRLAFRGRERARQFGWSMAASKLEQMLKTQRELSGIPSKMS